MVVSVEACLRENPGASLEEVREFLAGNLCRCGTYMSILEAVHDLVSSAAADDSPPEGDPRPANGGEPIDGTPAPDPEVQDLRPALTECGTRRPPTGSNPPR